MIRALLNLFRELTFPFPEFPHEDDLP